MISHSFDLQILRGLAELERTERGWLPHRLPSRARAQCTDPQLAAAESQPSGVRLAFRTNSSVIELDLLRTRTVLVGMPSRPDGTVDLVVDGRLTQQTTTTGGDVVTVDPTSGVTEIERGAVGTVRFDALSLADKDVEIWLPHNERTELAALRTDAPIVPLVNGSRPVWLHHGSSISQGSNAASPSTTWPAVAASLGGTELINLGLAGSAMLDQFTARAMRDTAADVVSVKIGINLVNTDLMRLRAFGPAVHGFLDTIRDGKPDAPLLVVGPLYCPIHEATPGPSAFDTAALAAGQVRFRAAGEPSQAASTATALDRLTLSVIRDELARIVAARTAVDPRLFYLDGRDLYGPDDEADTPLSDHLHPDAPTHQMIGQRFFRLAFAPGGPLADRM